MTHIRLFLESSVPPVFIVPTSSVSLSLPSLYYLLAHLSATQGFGYLGSPQECYALPVPCGTRGRLGYDLPTWAAWSQIGVVSGVVVPNFFKYRISPGDLCI